MIPAGKNLELSFTVSHLTMPLTCSKSLNSSSLVTKVQPLCMPFKAAYLLAPGCLYRGLALSTSSFLRMPWAPWGLSHPQPPHLLFPSTASLHRLFWLLRGWPLAFSPAQTPYVFKLSLNAHSSLMPSPTFPGWVVYSLCCRSTALGTYFCLGTCPMAFDLLIQGKMWHSSLYSSYLSHSESSIPHNLKQKFGELRTG